MSCACSPLRSLVESRLVRYVNPSFSRARFVCAVLQSVSLRRPCSCLTLHVRALEQTANRKPQSPPLRTSDSRPAQLPRTRYDSLPAHLITSHHSLRRQSNTTRPHVPFRGSEPAADPADCLRPFRRSPGRHIQGCVRMGDDVGLNFTLWFGAVVRGLRWGGSNRCARCEGYRPLRSHRRIDNRRICAADSA
ncbi:hypothetical protein DENSPDRAFT_174567 [Dentipellis sp. KUC8613]|nr:hypothetical protein DENSPDRAFT_174567 [Dentipellis sp. KUC8613]